VAGCEAWYKLKYGNLDKYNQRKLNLSESAKKSNKDKIKLYYASLLDKKSSKLNNWIEEKHTCEKCGKIMTEYYGSGRFCSRACANSHTLSEYTKKKISATRKNKPIKENKNVVEYLKNPKHCVVCNKELDYSIRHRKTCSDKCYRELFSCIRTKYIEDNGLYRTAIKTYKYGVYKGVECDSSWELAFVIYCIDHNIEVRRNKQFFEYMYDNKVHRYFPDFIIDGVYYEIKNFYTDVVEAKIEQFPEDKTLKIVDANSIKYYINYVTDTYGNDFYNMYDKDKPSWKNAPVA